MPVSRRIRAPARHCNENINELVGKYYDASQFIDYNTNCLRKGDCRKVIALGINFSSEKGTIDGFLTKEIVL